MEVELNSASADLKSKGAQYVYYLCSPLKTPMESPIGIFLISYGISYGAEY